MHPADQEQGPTRGTVQVIAMCTCEYDPKTELSLLDKEERERYSAFRNPAQGHDFAAAHILKRKALARHLGGCDPARLRFVRQPSGKPCLCDTVVYFNISHAQGIVALAFSDHIQCGIDIEAHFRGGINDSLIAKSMTEEERRTIAEAEFPHLDFYDRWVIKEALVKAQGVGLSRSFDTICTARDFHPLNRDQGRIGNSLIWHRRASGFSLAVGAIAQQARFIMDYPPSLSICKT
ncbi:4'-phosphopantetheinyl transferase superfamily protein [Billgrantia azerbaijanica]|nr:4'-phosphopantetheinyl transferase superfamily protein [Halomonas azerbaijanica]